MFLIVITRIYARKSACALFSKHAKEDFCCYDFYSSRKMKKFMNSTLAILRASNELWFVTAKFSFGFCPINTVASIFFLRQRHFSYSIAQVALYTKALYCKQNCIQLWLFHSITLNSTLQSHPQVCHQGPFRCSKIC